MASIPIDVAMTIVAFVAVIAFGLGWLMYGWLSHLHRRGAVRIMCLFAYWHNWSVKMVSNGDGKGPAYVWAGKQNPTELARRALE